MMALPLLAVAVAPSAHATQTSVTANCTAQSTTPLTMSVGDTVLITVSGSCDRTDFAMGVGTLTFGPAGTGTTVNAGAHAAVTTSDKVLYTATTIGTAIVSVNDSTQTPITLHEESWVITVTAPSSNTSPSTGSSAPTPVLQQFGKPMTGTCATAQPVNADWADVGTLGWGESWARWMNDGTGGFVCTRTLVYSASQARWVTE